MALNHRLMSTRIGASSTGVKSTESKRVYDAMKNILDSLTQKKVIDPWLLRSRLEADVLEACGLVNSEKGWTKKIVQRSTRIFYTQQKFNLLREESEGYSKLLTELVERALEPENDSEEVCAKVVGNVQSLIGFFVLDPNRVVDLILTAFEIRSDFLLARKSPLILTMSKLFSSLLRLFKVRYRGLFSSSSPPFQASNVFFSSCKRNKKRQHSSPFPHFLFRTPPALYGGWTSIL